MKKENKNIKIVMGNLEIKLMTINIILNIEFYLKENN